ncbi:MAG: TonB-dependent receptor, partial [Pseudomonadota bacterium]
AGTVPAGNELPDAPELSLNLGASYTTEISERLSLRFAIDSRYQAETFRDALNDPLLFTDAYWVTNGRISLFEEGNWNFSLWGKNLAEEEYVTQGINQLVFGGGFRIYGPPRTFGVSLVKQF